MCGRGWSRWKREWTFAMSACIDKICPLEKYAETIVLDQNLKYYTVSISFPMDYYQPFNNLTNSKSTPLQRMQHLCN